MKLIKHFLRPTKTVQVVIEQREKSFVYWNYWVYRFLQEPVLSERFLVTSLLEKTESEGVEMTKI